MSLSQTREDLLRRRRATGGETWTITRYLDDGAAFPVVPTTTAGAVDGLLSYQRPDGIAVTLPGQPAPSVTWTFTRTGGAALQTGDELTGAGGVRCRIGSRSARTYGEIWEATRL